MFGLVVGSTVGGFIPNLWGAGSFSFSSIFLSAIGAIVGIYIGYKVTR
ncbi:MAG: hypothetical protein JWL80_482 [Parcubacteria group bacterium]|nr:hypothetical protein [Parcubacteria group bacterium]